LAKALDQHHATEVGEAGVAKLESPSTRAGGHTRRRKKAELLRPANYSLKGANLPTINFAVLVPKKQVFYESKLSFTHFPGFNGLPHGAETVETVLQIEAFHHLAKAGC